MHLSKSVYEDAFAFRANLKNQLAPQSLSSFSLLCWFKKNMIVWNL